MDKHLEQSYSVLLMHTTSLFLLYYSAIALLCMLATTGESTVQFGGTRPLPVCEAAGEFREQHRHVRLRSPDATAASSPQVDFTDVMQFADFGPKLSVNPTNIQEGPDDGNYMMQLLGGVQKEAVVDQLAKNRRKRGRSVKTSDEVESQRRTHIALERNRRRQMNEHIRVLRSLMPSSYVQRGDQASIIGGAIEFVRELEQLLMCLESQKRRRVLGNGNSTSAVADGALPQPIHQPFLPVPFPPQNTDQMKLVELDRSGLREEIAENKSCIADIEVRLLGFDATIKIMSRKRPGQLIKTIAALEDLQFNIIHTNITTIDQTVLYSFNVKIASEANCNAEDIANSVQQILSFIDASML